MNILSELFLLTSHKTKDEQLLFIKTEIQVKILSTIPIDFQKYEDFESVKLINLLKKFVSDHKAFNYYNLLYFIIEWSCYYDHQYLSYLLNNDSRKIELFKQRYLQLRNQSLTSKEFILYPWDISAIPSTTTTTTTTSNTNTFLFNDPIIYTTKKTMNGYIPHILIVLEMITFYITYIL